LVKPRHSTRSEPPFAMRHRPYPGVGRCARVRKRERGGPFGAAPLTRIPIRP